ncbi:MFS transporter [Hippea maritima]|nr:MFS transporter [Hippea maritima]
MDKKKKNYLLGVAHGVFYFASNGFVDYTTVLPTFLKYLVNSNSLIGFVAAIARGGSIFFQLLSAFWLQGKKKKPYLVFSLWVRFLSWVMIAASSFVLLPSHPIIELVVFIVFISLFSFAGGIATIPFYDIISHNIPSQLLGRFWAMRQFIGGILAVGSGYAVKLILNNYGFPKGYQLLFVLAALGFGFTSLSLGLMDEGFEEQKQNRSFVAFLGDALSLLKNNPRFRGLVFSEFLSHSIFMCLPFVAIYTSSKLGMPTSKIGYFVSIQMVGSIASNLFWGYFADKKGARFIIITTNMLALLVPLFSLIFKNPVLFLAVFFVMGAYMHGTFIGYTNYLLKIAPSQQRPTYVSIRGTFNALSYFLPALGGYIADGFSFEVLFIVTLSFSFAALIVSLRLK